MCIIDRRYKDYREMLEEHPEIELVAIATESGSHAQIALDCIEAGKNVIIEKPMAMSMKDANEIIERAAEMNVKVSACHQNRFNEAVQRTRKALEAGRFGRMSHGTIHVRWNRGEMCIRDRKSIQAAIGENDYAAAAQSAQHASELTGSIAGELSSPLWMVASIVPVYGQDISGMRDLMTALDRSLIHI